MTKPRRTTTERGYGAEHRKVRAQWQTELEQRGALPCARCGELIHHGEAWDLGHTDDRSAYTGPEHRRCNRADGGRRRHRDTAPRRWVL